MELDPAWVNNHTYKNNIIEEKTLKKLHYRSNSKNVSGGDKEDFIDVRQFSQEANSMAFYKA